MGKRANNEGSIYRRQSDGKWVASITLDDGKRRVFYSKTKVVSRFYGLHYSRSLATTSRPADAALDGQSVGPGEHADGTYPGPTDRHQQS